MNIDPNLLRILWGNQMSSNSVNSSPLTISDSDVDFQLIMEQVLQEQPKTMRVITAQEAFKKLEMKGQMDEFTMPWSMPQAASNTSANAVVYEAEIMNASARHGVNPALIKAVIHTESSFKSDAVSHAGAKGLMQLMDATARSLGVDNSFDPAQNIHGGTQYLADLLNKYKGQEAVALAAYNAGPGRMDRLGIHTEADLMNRLSELPKETQNYIFKVEQNKRLYY